jgi:ribulose-phosphate 3-epimerase
MVDNPWKYIEHLSAMYNTEIVTFHAEAASDPKSLVDRIHGFENRRRNNEHVKAGIALNPKTPLDAVSKILPYVDMVLLMSVVPGACNQAYDDSVTGKISRLRDMINEKGLNTIIQVDGGIKQGNAYKVINAGADCAGGLIIVSGSGIYGAKQPVEVIDAMRHPVLVGADHGGVDLKNKFIDIFQGDGIPYFDFGTHGGPDVSVDHPIFARLVAENISSGRYKRGILVCGTGIGMSIGANRFENVRATVLYDASVDGKRIAQLAREHNDSNLAIFGSRSMDHETAKKDLYLWLNTPHLGGKYTARNGMFDMPG